MKLLDLLVGLEERGDRHGHDLRLTALNNTAYLDCEHCQLAVTVTLTGELGGWRIDPNIAALDRRCDG